MLYAYVYTGLFRLYIHKNIPIHCITYMLHYTICILYYFCTYNNIYLYTLYCTSHCTLYYLHITLHYTSNSTTLTLILYAIDAEEVSADKPVVISKYILNAKEIEFDAVAQVLLVCILLLPCCYYCYYCHYYCYCYPYHAATPICTSTIAIPLLLLYLLLSCIYSNANSVCIYRVYAVCV